VSAFGAIERPSYAEAARALLRDRVLDAAGELLRDRPWHGVTMAAIAARAGVSRQTLYNAFGSRSELAQAYVMREADRFLEPVQEAIAANASDPRAALGAAFAAFLDMARTHPLVRAISSAEESDELLALVTSRGGPLVEEISDRLAATLRATWPALEAADARLISETLVRLAISHAALPSDTPERTAASVSRLLGPVADELLR
jgi:AcrR family transcriptional regulator